jgi:hypothetical protein
MTNDKTTKMINGKRMYLVNGVWMSAKAAREATTENLYLIEFYQVGPNGETGWEIQFAWVQAKNPTDAKIFLKDFPFSKFDEVITCEEMSSVSPLAMKKAPLFIRVSDKFLRN